MKLYPESYSQAAAPPAIPKAGPIPFSKLSKPGQEIFARWREYLAALNGNKPSAFYVTRKQAAILNKSLPAPCTAYTYDGLPIEVYAG